MATITINGRNYPRKPITYGVMCDLEDRGLCIATMEDNIMKAARAYAGLCMGKSNRQAAEEIEKHVINGGSLDDIYNAFSEEIEASDFFQAMQRETEEAETRTEA